MWRGYALDTLPATNIARMIYRELEIEIVKLERGARPASDDPDDDYIPNLHNTQIGL